MYPHRRRLMARGFILSAQNRATVSLITNPPFSPPKRKNPAFIYHRHIHIPPPYVSPVRLFSCKCSVATQDQTPIEKYKEAFFRRMAMARLKPHHRIALGVSGGPDSMALCFLTAWWKTHGLNAAGKTDGFIDGVLAIIVDHGLRTKSNEEAHLVYHRVSQMGIRCEIARCSWSNGKPKQGHLQEAAREMRYQIFQNICTHHQIGILLIAHHADDQAELFILRLSRNSGVLGLAGMAFSSQIFSPSTHFYDDGSKNEGMLLVRPLLHFSKEDMYQICKGGDLDWVEDPTNHSPLYARNRIRLSLGNLSSYTFQSELQAVISACRKTRAYVEQICCNMINQAVTIMDQGYAVIDLEIVNPSKLSDLCLSKFVALVLQFISQRPRPVRGSTSKLLLDYFRTFPCKTSLTAAGCYLCPAPRSKGTKILVCCSVNCPQPSQMELSYPHSNGEQKQDIANEIEQIIADGKSFYDQFVPGSSDVYFLDATSDSVLTEAKRLNIISESTYRNILLLRRDEIKHFKPKTEDKVDYELKKEVESIRSPSEPLQPGQFCYFMSRFLVIWNLSKNIATNAAPENDDLLMAEEGDHHQCCSCDHEMVAQVRHMVESDWLYLAKFSNCVISDSLQQHRICIANKTEQITEERNTHLNYRGLSAQRALVLLKSIPAAARRSLPVLVNHQGLVLSIPSIGFRNCPCLEVSCEFKPRVPIGGGYASFM